MVTLTTAQKAAILLDGAPVSGASQIIPSSNNFTVNTEGDGVTYVYANVASPNVQTVTVRKDGREGSVNFTIAEAPLDITLAAPEPK